MMVFGRMILTRALEIPKIYKTEVSFSENSFDGIMLPYYRENFSQYSKPTCDPGGQAGSGQAKFGQIFQNFGGRDAYTFYFLTV